MRNSINNYLKRLISKILLFIIAGFSIAFSIETKQKENVKKDTTLKDTMLNIIDTSFQHAQPEYGVIFPDLTKDTIKLFPQQQDTTWKKERKPPKK